MEKILEKSGKSQGILLVRKSGNPVIDALFDWSVLINLLNKLKQQGVMINTRK